MSNKIREEVRKILSELIESTSSECPFLLGNENNTNDWYESGLKSLSVKLFKEGLIKTYPFDFAVQRLGEYGTVKLISNKIYLGLKKEYFNKIEGLVKYLDTLGYFAATFKVLSKDQEVSPDNYKNFNDAKEVLSATDNAQQVWIEIEAKYDDSTGDASSFFYHLTSKNALGKIKKQGLVPRSKSKKSHHPDRIYIVDDLKSLRQLLIQFSEIEGKELFDYVVLKIDYNLTSKPKIYNDPNFLSLGYYVVDNIPPTAIVDTIEAVDVLKND